MEFDPSTILRQRSAGDISNSSLIILNQPIDDFERLALIWKNTSYRICADGGANRLRELISAQHYGTEDDYVLRIAVSQ
jgi:thiamine pyrophosphokinase